MVEPAAADDFGHRLDHSKLQREVSYETAH